MCCSAGHSEPPYPAAALGSAVHTDLAHAWQPAISSNDHQMPISKVCNTHGSQYPKLQVGLEREIMLQEEPGCVASQNGFREMCSQQATAEGVPAGAAAERWALSPGYTCCGAIACVPCTPESY